MLFQDKTDFVLFSFLLVSGDQDLHKWATNEDVRKSVMSPFPTGP